jgi:DNA-directed RNA polymerase specialized sigma24 family protein
MIPVADLNPDTSSSDLATGAETVASVDDASTEDAVQEAYLKAFSNLSSFL